MHSTSVRGDAGFPILGRKWGEASQIHIRVASERTLWQSAEGRDRSVFSIPGQRTSPHWLGRKRWTVLIGEQSRRADS